MSSTDDASTASLPLFDPQEGDIVLAPESAGEGYWVGAPTVYHDAATGRYILCYRRRRPRGELSDRGYVAAIATSRDGVRFQDIWQVSKEELETTSIEKSCVLRGEEGRYRYYLSYVDPADQRWRIDVIEADAPDAFDIATRQSVLTAASASAAHDLPVEGVKDPKVYRVGDAYLMHLSYVEGKPNADDASRMHATSDVYNTGILRAPSALAISSDGVSFSWNGRCLDTGKTGAWDGYQARIGCMIERDGVWHALYDGSASHEENYEEKIGLAQSRDLESWSSTTVDRPALTVPWATGCVRYADVVEVGNEIWYYYECARADGAHELRRAVARKMAARK